jgi:hypothetical protein
MALCRRLERRIQKCGVLGASYYRIGEKSLATRQGSARVRQSLRDKGLFKNRMPQLRSARAQLQIPPFPIKAFQIPYAMKKMETRSFADQTEFCEYCRPKKIVYFYIFQGVPQPQIVEVLVRESGPDESILLLRAEDDRGFLKDQSELIRENGQLTTRRWIDAQGVRSWSHGMLGGTYEDGEDLAPLFRNARKCAKIFPAPRTAPATNDKSEEGGG